ncbi:MAG: ATP-binding protein [Candidatus Saccharibacteria bacterium]
MAGITAIVCLISYFLLPKKNTFIASLAVYLLLAATIATLTITTGGVSSIFIGLWSLIGLFSSVFGLFGMIPAILTPCALIIYQLTNGGLTSPEIITITLSSVLPLIVGFVIWRGNPDKIEASDDKTIHGKSSELSEVANKSEVVINAIGDGVVAIDNRGVIRLINPAAQTIIGWSEKDALSLNYKSVLKLTNQKDEELDVNSDPIQQALNNNQQTRTNNLVATTNSGKKLMVSLVVSPIGESGSGAIIVFHDITKEKAEEREQAEFISTASHEMRTPVASIEGYIGLALNPQTAQIDSRARDFIMKAHASAEHLGRLFQDLLDVSKSEDGRLSNNPKVVNIITFVHDVVQGLKQKANDKGLKLIYKPMPENATEKFLAPAYYINLDNDHVREIVNNLVENAIKYTLFGDITIDVDSDDEHVIISVKDSGVGIPAEDMPHLFQKFYRVDNKDTREIGGTGLGLYLSRRLAETIGGRIWAESVYTKGSTFFIELPRISSQEASQLAEEEAIKTQQEANQVKVPIATATVKEQSMNVIQQVSSVPRSQTLTREQIAAYAAKQHALAQQHAASQENS